MRDMLYFVLFTLAWILSTADFSFEIGDRNQITIERMENKSDKPKKEEPDELKASW